MTSKDYELIASVISKFPDKHIYKIDLVIEFNKILVSSNSRFSPGKFAVACLGLDRRLDFKDQDAVAAEFDNEERK